MRKTRSMGWIAALAMVCVAETASADSVPVIDARSLVQEILQAERALEQIEILADQVERQIEALEVAIEQRDALRGSRGIGRLGNGADARAARRTLPSDLDGLLALGDASGPGDPATQRVRALVLARAAELGLVADSEVGVRDRIGSRDPTAAAYARSRRETLAALAVSEEAYGDSARRLATIEALLAEIDRTPDVKASTDLMSRIGAENGLMLNELLRLQALSMAGSAGERANALVSRSNVARFGSFDPEKLRSLAERLALGAGPPSVGRADERRALAERSTRGGDENP